ncbi:MAG: bacterial Ig-like domain-containing protein [Treponema sp.]|nr:bacterial Ig-like domain-containing protein [Candidatus Treponema merdequi]
MKKFFKLFLTLCVGLVLVSCQQPNSELPEDKLPLLSSIEITAQPTKTVYIVGEELDTTGLEVTAVYSDESRKTVNNWKTSGFDSSKAITNQTVTISYTENEVTKTAEFNVEIKEKKLENPPENPPEEPPVENPPKTEPPVTYEVKFEVVEEAEYWWKVPTCEDMIKIEKSDVLKILLDYIEEHKPSFETKTLKENEEHVLESYNVWMIGSEDNPNSRYEVKYFADEELTSPIEFGSIIKNENKTIYVELVWYLYKESYNTNK